MKFGSLLIVLLAQPLPQFLDSVTIAAGDRIWSRLHDDSDFRKCHVLKHFQSDDFALLYGQVAQEIL